MNLCTLRNNIMYCETERISFRSRNSNELEMLLEKLYHEMKKEPVNVKTNPPCKLLYDRYFTLWHTHNWESKPILTKPGNERSKESNENGPNWKLNNEWWCFEPILNHHCESLRDDEGLYRSSSSSLSFNNSFQPFFIYFILTTNLPILLS